MKDTITIWALGPIAVFGAISSLAALAALHLITNGGARFLQQSN